MKYIIENQKLFYLFISLLWFFSSCSGDHSGRQRDQSRLSREISCPEAELSEEQKVQITEIRQSVRNSNHESSREERQIIGAELQEKILDIVPETEEQRKALTQCFEQRRERRSRNNGGAERAAKADT